MKICKQCDKEVAYKGLCKNHYNKQMSEYMTARYHRRRNNFIDSRGGKCESCGRSSGLEIDHVIPDDKSFSIGQVLSSGSEEKVLAELAKCQVLCTDCHKNKTRAYYRLI